MQKLSYTTVTNGGDAFDIRFPLHDETRSAEIVAAILSAVLSSVSAEIEQESKTSDGDVLQALAMAMAVRARLVDVPPAVSLKLMHELVDEAFSATLAAERYRAARA
jgi:hypothetical protein